MTKKDLAKELNRLADWDDGFACAANWDKKTDNRQHIECLNTRLASVMSGFRTIAVYLEHGHD